VITETDLPESLDALDPQAMLAVAEAVGLAPPTLDEMRFARDMAATLMGHDVVSLETLIAVQEVQPAATLVFKEEGVVTGVSGQLLLRRSAVRAMCDGRFDALNVELDHASRAGETPALGYAWGIAASTKPGGAAVIAVGKALRATLFPRLTIFTRAVTPVGRHVALSRYGYQPLRRPDDELLIRLARPQAEAA